VSIVDVFIYGFYGLNQTESSFEDANDDSFNLSAPTLNISAYYIAPDPAYDVGGPLFGTDWVDPRTGKAPFNISSNAAYTTLTSNETLILGDSSTRGKCQPDVTYKWGFSFVLLFIFLVLLMIWTTGTFILWLKARLSMRHDTDWEVVGEYKAIIELATAMNNDFGKHGDNPGTLRERQIRSKIKHDLNGGSIMYHSPLREINFRFRDGLKRWFKRNKWWLLAFFISAGCAIVAAAAVLADQEEPHNADQVNPIGGTAFSMFCIFLCSGVLTARMVGRTKRSRGLILASFTLIGVIVASIWSARQRAYQQALEDMDIPWNDWK